MLGEARAAAPVLFAAPFGDAYRSVMRQAFAPVGTRLRKAAATEDGGESVLCYAAGAFLDSRHPRR